MANRVALAIENRAPLVIEAGTGTGKTFAYLVPALLSG
jgi:ATP-dependent DNA helicase DinG